jgi:rhamnopyranosyl-N-acetylglucosaminyl-diphospho-decaprenol beta-1,3/1,4-galactofuranosyltransferase
MKRNLPMYDICAIVVTYNRKELLCECLEALLSQTYPLNKIYLIDNAGTDGTDMLLEQKGYLQNPVIVYEKLSENIGGAGGFSYGLQKAYENAHDFYYLLDDDAEPKYDAIEHLVPFLDKPYGAFASAVYNNFELRQTAHRGNFDYYHIYPTPQKALPLAKYAQESIEIDMASFVGFLISRETVAKIGFPKTEFFIHFDDTEYCMRLSQYSKILMVPASIIYHKEKRQEEKVEKSFLWMQKSRIRYDKLWIKYFGRRNSVYLASRHSTCKLHFFWTLLLEYLVLVKDILLYDDNKYKRFKFASASYLDGILGKFDNQKSKKFLSR